MIILRLLLTQQFLQSRHLLPQELLKMQRVYGITPVEMGAQGEPELRALVALVVVPWRITPLIISKEHKQKKGSPEPK
jgi:hypothetical protein